MYFYRSETFLFAAKLAQNNIQIYFQILSIFWKYIKIEHINFNENVSFFVDNIVSFINFWASVPAMPELLTPRFQEEQGFLQITNFSFRGKAGTDHHLAIFLKRMVFWKYSKIGHINFKENVPFFRYNTMSFYNFLDQCAINAECFDTKVLGRLCIFIDQRPFYLRQRWHKTTFRYIFKNYRFFGNT